jgi:hypothetical protein
MTGAITHDGEDGRGPAGFQRPGGSES